MKLKCVFALSVALLATGLVRAQDAGKSVTGIVTTRLVLPGDKTIAFVLVQPGQPTQPVLASGADAAALVPRNAITLTGTAATSAIGPALQVTAGSVAVSDTNQPFKSQTIAAADLKDATALADVYVQLPKVTFAAATFDASGTAQVKTEDGTAITLLVSKSAAGRATPKSATDVFGVVVKNGGEWRIVATRFLPVNRKEIQDLATKYTCLTCHNPDTKVVGPPYRDVAASYRNDPDATTKIIAQITNGGTGKWGAIPMPPLKAVVPPDDMARLAEWILGYRWDAILAE